MFGEHSRCDFVYNYTEPTFSGGRGILHNPETFPEPFIFKPERFLGDEDVVKTNVNLTRFAFGRGRRYVFGP